MKTKIVYILVSAPNDIYLEQTWVSIWSLKHYNPDAHTTVVMDDDTAKNINNCSRNGISNYIDEKISIDFPSTTSNVERSRIIKTTLREIVKGDFLFFDSDTVITDTLHEIDFCEGHVAMVYDLHNRMSEYTFADIIRKGIKKNFNVELKPNTNQYNSGVIYAKDDEEAHLFYKRWHELWNLKKIETSYRDQPSLVVACDENPNAVVPLSGIYNCQIMISIAYLHKAKIIHFFNTQWKKTRISPFFGKDLYMKVKSTGSLTDDIKEMILNCKSEFSSPSMPIMISEIQFGRSHIYKDLLFLFENYRKVFNFLERLLDMSGKVKNVILCQKKKN